MKTLRFSLLNISMDYNREVILSAPPGTTFIDIGAHIGLYSRIAAERGLKVFAFEPVPVCARILKDALAPYPNAHVIEKAVSDRIGRATMWYGSKDPDKPHGGNTIVPAVAHGHYGHNLQTPLEVETITLDRFIFEEEISDLTALKIDVEGAEDLVIAGGLDTLKNFSPAIALDTHEVVDLGKVWKMLGGIGYSAWLGTEEVDHLRENRNYLLRRNP